MLGLNPPSDIAEYLRGYVYDESDDESTFHSSTDFSKRIRIKNAKFVEKSEFDDSFYKRYFT